MAITEWFDDRAGDIANLSSGAWTALAAWLALCVTIAALVYAWRQFQSAKHETEDISQPNVAMFMEPSSTDWHLVELVVKNFGQKPAYGIKFEFATPPTVPRYEGADADNYVDIVPLKLPAEIPYLAPTQEWRTVWDSALDRKQLGESIGSRFAGAVTFYDQPNSSRQGKTKHKRHQFRTPAVLDWSTLHPVERLELLTSHDLARQEKQKLELLRGLLTYYHYAATESRQEALQSEINRINAAANEQRDRYRSQFVEQEVPQRNPVAPAAPVSVDELPPKPAPLRYANQSPQRYDGLPPEYDDPPPSYDDEPPPYDDDDAQTRVINGRHRRGLGGG
ncbi:hypothetical protein [Mycolicibacterium stellerae]|uniref:hypothetical protein n=1 Tax=Mycolicibacterium stellerae TaxID=2358193 RepID=UPI001F200FA3|nr:hypothetical protein [Mycolicibacterium stellerae]